MKKRYIDIYKKDYTVCTDLLEAILNPNVIRIRNIKDDRFGRLVAVRPMYRKNVNRYWLCKCDCGNYSIIRLENLQSGNTRSCGCLNIEVNGDGTKTKNSTGREFWGDRKYRKWRRQVFKRDNYTCQLCKNNKGGNLNAHHIRTWLMYPDLRYNIDNGITLCVECHKKVHKLAKMLSNKNFFRPGII